MKIKGCGYLLLCKNKDRCQALHNEDYSPFENDYSSVPYFDLAIDVVPRQLNFDTRFFDLNQNEIQRHENHAYKKP